MTLWTSEYEVSNGACCSSVLIILSKVTFCCSSEFLCFCFSLTSGLRTFQSKWRSRKTRLIIKTEIEAFSLKVSVGRRESAASGVITALLIGAESQAAL